MSKKMNKTTDPVVRRPVETIDESIAAAKGMGAGRARAGLLAAKARIVKGRS